MSDIFNPRPATTNHHCGMPCRNAGAFQVKIVDFGLATLIHNQSQEEIDKMDAVYGSVFFMPPEQYERKTLDVRSDLYSLGCCFYQALAGSYPFNGTTGMEVMQAHLDHTVRPIREIRDDIPQWACDWIMWMINRNPGERPATARDALSVFLQNNKKTEPSGSPKKASGSQPRLITSSLPSTTATGPLPTSRETTTVHTAAPSAANRTLGATGAFPTAGKPKPLKKVLRIAIPSAVALLIALTVWLMVKRNEGVRQKNAYHNIIVMAEKDNVRQIHLNGAQLRIVFDFIVNAKPNVNLAPAYGVLVKATGIDGTNIDAAIVDFAITASLPDGIRHKLFKEVIGKRESSAPVPVIMKYTATAGEPDDAITAFGAIRPMVREEHVGGLLGIIASTKHLRVRQAAVLAMSEIIAGSSSRNDLAELISKSGREVDNPAARPQFDRLLAQSKAREPGLAQAQSQPGAQARERTTQTPKANQRRGSSNQPTEWAGIMESFDASDAAGKFGIIATLGRTPDEKSHGALREIAVAEQHAHLKPRVIQALVELNSLPEMHADGSNMRQHWLQTIWSSDTHEQKIMVIDALAKFRAEWATILIEEMSRGPDNPARLHGRKNPPRSQVKPRARRSV